MIISYHYREPTALPMAEINLLTVIPWFHSFGCLTLITTGVMGACLIYLPKFEEHLFLSAIEVICFTQKLLIYKNNVISFCRNTVF